MLRPGADIAEVVAGLLDARVVASTRLAGGDAGEAYEVRLVDHSGRGFTVFAKTPLAPSPGTLAAEAAGLRWLAETRTVRVPQVVSVRDEPDLARPVLVLEWLASAPPAPDHDEQLGRALAELHRFPCALVGLETDNWVGALPQDNRPAPTWAEFYASSRLEPLVRIAVDRARLPATATDRLSQLIERLPDLVGPPEAPSRLHGDLWAGNAITDDQGRPVVVDPAVYGGHREVDLAMMRLFGGFGDAVFRAYDEVHPLAEGHRDRVELYQLYPLLVHTVLFGGGYASSAQRTLDRYG